MVLCLISRHSSNTQSKQRKRKKTLSSAAAKEAKRERNRALHYIALDSRKNFFAYICNVSGLQVFILICLVLICPTWKFSDTFMLSCLWMSFVCMAIYIFLFFFYFCSHSVPFIVVVISDNAKISNQMRECWRIHFCSIAIQLSSFLSFFFYIFMQRE